MVSGNMESSVILFEHCTCIATSPLHFVTDQRHFWDDNHDIIQQGKQTFGYHVIPDETGYTYIQLVTFQRD